MLAAEYGFRVLALDSNPHQTNGALRRDEDIARIVKSASEETSNDLPQGSLTHQTAFIGDPVALRNAITQWVKDESSVESSERQVTIVVIALHACGDLTPSTLRLLSSPGQEAEWSLTGAVVVGCCYNLMTESSKPHYTTEVVHLTNDLHRLPALQRRCRGSEFFGKATQTLAPASTSRNTEPSHMGNVRRK